MANGRWGGRASPHGKDGGPGSGPKSGGGGKSSKPLTNGQPMQFLASMSAKRKPETPPVAAPAASKSTSHMSTYGSYGQGGRPRNRTREMSPEASHSMHSATKEAKKGQSPFKK